MRKVIRDEQILSAFDNAAANNWDVKAYRVDWQNSADTLLDETPYTTSIEYDALNRVKVMRYPQTVDGGPRKELVPRYNRAGALEEVTLDGKPYVERIAYNAKGQRVLIAYGNGVITRYAYDPRTFRLGRLRSEKYNHPDSLTYRFQEAPFQDFGYEYDLVGNIIKIRDCTPKSGIIDNPQAFEVTNQQLAELLAAGDALIRKFEYEPIYRLRSATGRECDLPPSESPAWADEIRCTDLTKTRAYTEVYEYDKVGNIKQLTHQVNGFNRNRNFALKDGNNRLDTVTVGQTDYQYTYDNNGNLIQENEARHFEWDYADRMRVFRTQPGNAEPSVHAHYLYDASGQRVKKLVRKQGGRFEVTVYVDGIFEYQRIVQGGETRENNTLHVMDNQSRIALVRVGNPFPDDTTPAVKYHLGDHLGSSNVVVDDAGNLVNREEYTPYGETSFGSFVRKRYRFSGKERDEESGLNYFGFRYYSLWLSRWINCDPLGVTGGINLYGYVKSNPMTFLDAKGLAPEADNICTPPMQPVSPSTQNSNSPGSRGNVKTDQAPSNEKLSPTSKNDSSSENLINKPVANITGRAASTETIKPNRVPLEKPSDTDHTLDPTLKPRKDPPPSIESGGLWKWLAPVLPFGFIVGAAIIINAAAAPAVGVGVAAPAAGSPTPTPPVPSNSSPKKITDLPGIRQATDIESARRAFSEAERVDLKLKIGVATQNEMKASKYYLEVFEKTRNFAEAGRKFHDEVGAQPSGADRYFFGSVNEVKTKNPFGIVSGEDMLKAIKQAEDYTSKGPPTVTFFEIGTGNKYIISR
ncbi:MAG: RHS repeat-associated core domain-containing protein [Fischerella sp. CENA71]|nr:RHS repeat-associated core domain-containing protein [Fischerella sp. CENA71]